MWDHSVPIHPSGVPKIVKRVLKFKVQHQIDQKASCCVRIIHGPCLLWPNGWMDQDAIWYGGRPRPSPDHIVLHGDPAPPPPKGHSPNFRSVSIVAKGSPIPATAEHLFILPVPKRLDAPRVQVRGVMRRLCGSLPQPGALIRHMGCVVLGIVGRQRSLLALCGAPGETTNDVSQLSNVGAAAAATFHRRPFGAKCCSLTAAKHAAAAL